MTVPVRTLPDGRAISRLGLGASSFWAKDAFPADEAIALVRQAHALGITHFDTGPSYANGEAERRLGQALAGLEPGTFTVSSKFGTHWRAGQGFVKDFSPELLEGVVDGSLQRLGLERLDVLLLHGPQVGDITEALIEEIERLKAKGKILWSGVHSHQDEVHRFALTHPFDAAMIQYNVFNQHAHGLIAENHESGRMVFNATTLGQGIFQPARFIPTSRKNAWYLARTLKNDPVFVLRSLRFARARRKTGLSPAEAAIGFVLREEGVTCAMFGTTSRANLAANAAAAGRDYADVDWAALDRL